MNTYVGAMANLRPEHLALIHKAQAVLGREVTLKAWDLFVKTGLIFPGSGDRWEMWGDKNPDGTSRGPVPHSLVVCWAQITLATKLGLSPEKVIRLGTAGFGHDAFKREEIESGDSEGTHQKAGAELTELFGSEVAALAEMSGHTAMPAVLARLGEVSVQVAFWVDNAVVGTELKPAAAKCDYLDRAAQPDPVTSKVRYQYNNLGVKIYGVPFFTFQRHLACTLEAALALGLGIQPTTTLADRLNQWMKE
ncbi:MAG: hypothetical protein Q8N84_02615 [bacterium]|nr:hypothetical protein [bacterium]